MFPFPRLLHVSVINRVVCVQSRCLNANRCAVVRPMRQKYLRLYPTRLLLPDGSSLVFRHHEPRAVVKLPLTLQDCKTQQAKSEWNQRRKRQDKVEIADDVVDVDYNKDKYLKLVMRR